MSENHYEVDEGAVCLFAYAYLYLSACKSLCACVCVCGCIQVHAREYVYVIPDICRGCLFMLLPCSASTNFWDRSSMTSRSAFLQVNFATSLDNKSAIMVHEGEKMKERKGWIEKRRDINEVSQKYVRYKRYEIS